jgi:3-vinyl bacteriochlorophyllide hydratase
MSLPQSLKSMGLYTPEERRRRDATPWTLVQGVLAPIQFLVFVVSAALVVRFLVTGNGYAAATASVLLKTLVLYTIMITGCVWERAVFGKYLFAAAFFWEDVISMFVLAIHTAYIGALLFGSLHARYQMYIALLAYSAYLINATQFLLKLRAARLEGNRQPARDRSQARGDAAADVSATGAGSAHAVPTGVAGSVT